VCGRILQLWSRSETLDISKHELQNIQQFNHSPTLLGGKLRRRREWCRIPDWASSVRTRRTAEHGLDVPSACYGHCCRLGVYHARMREHDGQGEPGNDEQGCDESAQVDRGAVLVARKCVTAALRENGVWKWCQDKGQRCRWLSIDLQPKPKHAPTSNGSQLAHSAQDKMINRKPRASTNESRITTRQGFSMISVKKTSRSTSEPRCHCGCSRCSTCNIILPASYID